MAHLERRALRRTQPCVASVDFATGYNAKWSKLFFGEHSPRLALADAIALEGMIFSYIRAARKVDRMAANVFIPYAAWVAFAAVLNSEIARLNPREA